ncbi:RIP metalloprotease RseP [Roseovarius sp. EL26]|uniref:RIP metalloprotease RseP n=1 Tax=Roseovarius sp. EL26 TaxID=2126672 RepID=UPI000EA10622|nr:RIP metalloprotease RseP [Roseovarius sp. EL26]
MEFSSFIPQFDGFLMTALAFVVALSVIVAIHEYGHYIVGRWCGIKAEVFSLGFGPVLFARTDKHGTQWQLAALPFGGYVKFLGDATAASGQSSDEVEAMDAVQRRKTMQGAPLWARAATVAAGPIFNFVLAIIIFAGVAMMQGTVKEPFSVGELRSSPVAEITLEPGDQIVRIAGFDFPEWGESGAFDAFIQNLPLEQALDYDVIRDGKTISVVGPYPMPPVIVGLAPRSAAYEAGLENGDVITRIDNSAVTAFSELKGVVESSNGRALKLDIWRDGEILELSLSPKRADERKDDGSFKTEWRIGIVGGLAFEPETVGAGPGAAVISGVNRLWTVIESSLSGLYHMITGAISSCNMSGPLGIAQVSGAMANQGASSFINFIAILSAAVGLMNLFPVPILDGGHLVFYAYEAVVRRPPSERIINALMSFGLVFVLGLMVFALGNDLFCP